MANGLTNFQLLDLAKDNNIKLDKVIMMDEILDLKVKKKHNLILNLQDTGGSGSHWVAFIVRPKKCLYIDSFGAFPHPTIVKWCLQNKLQLGYSAYICQDLKSQKCGYYCLQAIKATQQSTAHNLYDKANQYINQYEPNRKTNESIVMNLFFKFFSLR